MVFLRLIHVDHSLEDKLKCLIFIPIISRTYCDPKSFAWQHEFVVFNKLAKEDQFGRDIKLTSGNVTSRILPVKIHDLDPEDNTLLENELGGVLRCIEFIHKEPGVNRPLRANEEKPQDNLNKTTYRNQINKLSNAVKEIMAGLKNPDFPGKVITEKYVEEKSSTIKIKKIKIFVGSLILLGLVLASFFIAPHLFKSKELPDKSVAVLPFADVSPDKDQEYLGDGLADDIISALSGVEGLKVIGRTSSFQFKGQNVDLREVGQKLGVSTVLEGSVQKSQNILRVTVTLINVKDGSNIWSHKWDREMTDIFKLHDEIANGIREKFEISLMTSVKMTRTVNPVAYEDYLKGRRLMFTNIPENVKKAKGFFTSAVEKDPAFADGVAFLSLTYYTLGTSVYPYIEKERRQQAIDSSFSLAKQAISLDDNSSAAHLAMGQIYSYNYEWEKAEKEYRHAHDINPGTIQKNFLAIFLGEMGDFDEAFKLADDALIIDPLDINSLVSYSSILMMHKQYDDAIELLNKAIKIDSNSMRAYATLGHCYCEKQQFHEALMAWSRQHEIYGNYPLAEIYRKSDFKTAMQAWLNQADTPDAPISSGDFNVAVIYAYFKDKDNTFKYLDRAIQNHAGDIARLKSWPAFDFLKDDPRYKELYHKLYFDLYDEYRRKQKPGS